MKINIEKYLFIGLNSATPSESYYFNYNILSINVERMSKKGKIWKKIAICIFATN
jgi:hypothetical protein